MILNSQDVANLQYVSNKIIASAKDSGYTVKGPRYMPNKTLKISTRRAPNGEGTNTYDRFEMRIHTRIIEIKCPANSVSDITNFKIKPGVNINIKIWN